MAEKQRSTLSVLLAADCSLLLLLLTILTILTIQHSLASLSLLPAENYWAQIKSCCLQMKHFRTFFQAKVAAKTGRETDGTGPTIAQRQGAARENGGK